MKINDLTESQVVALRNEIVLNSLFIGDYKNSFAIDAEEVCNFFNGFIEWGYERWKENHTKEEKCEIEDIDTIENLIEYFYCTE